MSFGKDMHEEALLNLMKVKVTATDVPNVESKLPLFKSKPKSTTISTKSQLASIKTIVLELCNEVRVLKDGFNQLKVEQVQLLRQNAQLAQLIVMISQNNKLI